MLGSILTVGSALGPQAHRRVQAPGVVSRLRQLQPHRPVHKEAAGGRRLGLRGVHLQQVLRHPSSAAPPLRPTSCSMSVAGAVGSWSFLPLRLNTQDTVPVTALRPLLFLTSVPAPVCLQLVGLLLSLLLANLVTLDGMPDNCEACFICWVLLHYYKYSGAFRSVTWKQSDPFGYFRDL